MEQQRIRALNNSVVRDCNFFPAKERNTNTQSEDPEAKRAFTKCLLPGYPPRSSLCALKKYIIEVSANGPFLGRIIAEAARELPTSSLQAI